MDGSIRSKVIRGSQNFEIRSRDLGHADIGVVLWSGRSRDPSSMSVPNLKWMALFVQKLLGGSQNFEIESRDLGHAHFGVIL